MKDKEIEKAKTLEVVYTWQEGSEEVHYRRDFPSEEATRLIDEIKALKIKQPLTKYSYRIV